MNDQNSSNQSNNSLENILKELEERFGANSNQEEKSPSSKKPKGINFKHFTQSQIVGSLTLVLLVVGAAVGVYLGQINQENRQQASTYFPTCGAGSTGGCNPGDAAGSSQCTAFTGGPGTCQNSETNAACSCVPNQAITPSPTTPACIGPGGSCTIGAGNAACCNPNEYSCANNPSGFGHCVKTQCTSCVPATGVCPGGGTESGICQIGDGLGVCCVGGGTNTPTRTPTTVVASNSPTRTPTTVPPTSVPPTSVPPTSPPGATATRTPTTVPVSTTPAPTCNGITITYGTTTEPTRPVRIGDIITLTCGAIAGANHYEFRLGLNGNFLQNIAAIAAGSRVSQPFTIAQSGTYGAQCRMCTDSTSTSCQPWETLQ